MLNTFVETESHFQSISFGYDINKCLLHYSQMVLSKLKLFIIHMPPRSSSNLIRAYDKIKINHVNSLTATAAASTEFPRKSIKIPSLTRSRMAVTVLVLPRDRY